ncbi:MAG: hypothetical protein V6Z89_18500 [Desulfobacter sp.]
MQKIICFKTYRADALWSFSVGAILFAISYQFKINVFYFDYWFLSFSVLYIIASYRKYFVAGEDGFVLRIGVIKQTKISVKWPDIIGIHLEKRKRKYTTSVGARIWIPVVIEEEAACLQIKLVPNAFNDVKKALAKSKRYVKLNEENCSLDLWENEHFDLYQISKFIAEYKPVEKNNIELTPYKINYFGKLILFGFSIVMTLSIALYVIWLFNRFVP